MLILGLNTYHGDASACIIKNGKLITAIEEERFTRIKHTAGFPIQAIKSCLLQAGVKIDDIDYITINRNPSLRAIKKIKYILKKGGFINNIIDRFQNYRKILNLENEIKKNFFFKKNLKNKINYIDHHLSHAASSVLSSGFQDTCYITLDGFGDFTSTTIGIYENRKFSQLKEVNFPHSIGIFYTMMTQYLGFKNYGDEYKVMGLSAYGKPIYQDKIYKLINFSKKDLFQLNLKYFSHHNGIETSWLEGSPVIDDIFSNHLIELFGLPRKSTDQLTSHHKDIAASVQKVYEEITINILNYLYDKTKKENLCISGGCALNSLANGKFKKRTGFKKIFIPHCPGDSGGSIGSAMYYMNLKKINIELKSFKTPYLGPDFTKKDIELNIRENSSVFDKNKFTVEELNDDEIFEFISEQIMKQKVIGLFRGRSEFGARALGNRSIIADPRDIRIKEIINLKIKKREGFRPFAPAVLSEFAKDWFECDDDYTQYMSKVYPVKQSKKNLIPAVVHVDGTGRLQTVKKEENYFFYNMINKFYEKTNVPILLNTSFNENEPIVNVPNEAINCFIRTNMDILIIENFVITR